jgi:molybdopterin-guanine dinucleotide biosynthesis protein B
LHRTAAILGVVGRKNSGKTSVIESIIQELTKRGYQVATAKHVNQQGFSMDTKGKDTWRHSVAGANPVLSVSDIETAVLIRDGVQRFSLEWMRRYAPEADIGLVEGFSSLTLKDEHVGKIVCVRNEEEYKEFKQKSSGQVIAFCSVQPLEKPILSIEKDRHILVERAVKYVKRNRQIAEILGQLPGLDCGKCGYTTCEEMALAIYRRKAKLSNCVTLKLRSKLKTRLTINDTEVPLQPFVSEIIRKSLLGMVSTLKGVSIEGNEEIHIELMS